MVTQVVKTVNPNGSGANNFTTAAAAFTYLRSLNPVADDIDVTFIDYIGVVWSSSTGPAGAVDDTHKVTWTAAPGLGTNDINRGVFDVGSTGITVTWPRKIDGFWIDPGVDFINLNIVIAETGRGDSVNFNAASGRSDFDNKIKFCRFIDKSLVIGGRILLGASFNRTEFSDSLIITERNDTLFSDNAGKSRFRRCTMVARGAGLNGATFISTQYGGPIISDSVFIGFGPTILSNATATNCYANTQPTAGTIAGITVNTAPGALVVNEANDFTPSAGGALIGTASSSAQFTPDILGGNRGAAPDIGARQRVAVAAVPTATVTSTQVSGSTVTISGTTTNAPTSGKASLAPAAVAYNDGVAQNNVDITLGTGTFTVTFSNVHVGRYTPTLTLTNGGGTATASGATNVDIPGATGIITNQSIDGEVLTISGTTSGNPASGTCLVPVAATSNGAVAAGPVALALGNGTFTVTIPLQPGSYAEPVARFTTANGTGFPATGGQGVTVLGFTGNPEAPPGDGSAPVATVSGVSVTPATASGAQHFSATVIGTNSPSQTVSWTASKGSINSAGDFTPPAATSVDQVITITATSVIDPSKSGTATVTIAAVVAPPAATVSSVTITPNAATVAGGATQQFSASVNGTNTPPQGVTWAANKGSISAGGLLTAPAATSAAQTIIVTVTSTFDTSKSGTATVTVPAVVVTPPGDTTPPDTTPPTTTTRVFSVQLTVDGKTGVPNLSGLVVRCYNGDGSLALSINNGTTDANGWVSVAAQSTLPVGGVGMLVVRGAGRHFADFVQVA